MIIDEKRARRVARSLGLPITGVVGIIGDAAKQGMVPFDDAIDCLQATGFFLSEAVIETVRRSLDSPQDEDAYH